MSDTVQVLLQYGYLVLFAFVLAEQVGLPIPAVASRRPAPLEGGVVESVIRAPNPSTCCCWKYPNG